jgi:hypothetical protein
MQFALWISDYPPARHDRSGPLQTKVATAHYEVEIVESAISAKGRQPATDGSDGSAPTARGSVSRLLLLQFLPPPPFLLQYIPKRELLWSELTSLVHVRAIVRRLAGFPYEAVALVTDASTISRDLPCGLLGIHQRDCGRYSLATKSRNRLPV